MTVRFYVEDELPEDLNRYIRLLNPVVVNEEKDEEEEDDDGGS